MAVLMLRFKHFPNMQFMHTGHRTLRVCVQKGGWAMCALQGARRTGAFKRSEAGQVRPDGDRSPSSAGTPFAVTGGHLALFWGLEWASPCG